MCFKNLYKISVSGFVLLVAFVFPSCLPQNPFLSEEDAEEIKKPDYFKLALIIDDNIYLVSDYAYNDPLQLTFDISDKKEVKINWSGDKIAYIDNNSDVVIISDDGTVLEQQNLENPVKQIDWINNSTLYMFDGAKIYYSNGIVDVVDLPVPSGISSSLYTSSWVKTACVNNNSELIYVRGFFNSYTYDRFFKLVVKNSVSEKYFALPDYDYCLKVFFDGEKRPNIWLSDSETETYIFTQRKIFDDFYSLLNASDISFESLYKDYFGYYWPQNKTVTLLGYINEYSGGTDHYTLEVTDYGKADYEHLFESSSLEDKIYFDFK